MEKSLREVLGEKIEKLGINNKDIVVIDCDMARHTKMDSFERTFPDRFYQAGIAEQNAIGIAAGMARGGKIPIVSSMAMFICGRAWEQIRHSVIYNETNVKIIGTHAGLSDGEDGASHQCFEDLALMLALPRIEIFAPAFPKECESICDHIVSSSKPSYIRVGRGSVHYDLEETYYVGLPIVKGDTNSDIAIISTGEITQEIYLLLERDIHFKSIHIGVLRPFNVEAVKTALMNSSKIIVVEESSKYGGLASLLYINHILDNKCVICINMDEKFGQTGTEYELRHYYGMSSEQIEEKVRSFL